jgi:hypothetical protein
MAQIDELTIDDLKKLFKMICNGLNIIRIT